MQQTFDIRRDLIVPGDQEATISFCAERFLTLAEQAIKHSGYFNVALSGGSTPKSVYQRLTERAASRIAWDRVRLFWSDERCVPLNHEDSNYRMAMEAGFAQLSIPRQNIFPLYSEGNIEEAAKNYEKCILEKIPGGVFDLILLGMGEDGHTASLFPHTAGLLRNRELVLPNYLSNKGVWRMTLSFACINRAKAIDIYVSGKSKALVVRRVLKSDYDPDHLPIQRVGTPDHKALWILDLDASSAI